MYLSGYNIGPEAAQNTPSPNPALAPRRPSPANQNIALVFGYPERVGDEVANASVLIGPDGAILLNYRKSHLFGDLDRSMFQAAGTEFPIATLMGQKIGLLICYDIEFPEPARRLALAGADIILIATALMEPYEQVANHVIPARAYENQVYLAYANHSGTATGSTISACRAFAARTAKSSPQPARRGDPLCRPPTPRITLPSAGPTRC